MSAEVVAAEGDVPPDIAEVVARVRAGETFAAVARELHPDKRPVAAKVALYRYLLGGLGDERYHELVTELLVLRVMEADEGLEAAADKVEVSKRKAIAGYARMDFERRRPALYGPKQEVKHSGEVSRTFRVEIVREDEVPGGRVIDGTPVPPALPEPGEGTG